MHVKTMEGLIGARVNMNLTREPMRVFREASRKDDFATMERAMGYVNEYEDRAFEYKKTADDGMEKEAEENREKEKLAREEAIKKTPRGAEGAGGKAGGRASGEQDRGYGKERNRPKDGRHRRRKFWCGNRRCRYRDRRRNCYGCHGGIGSSRERFRYSV